jgi:hypothetical protein
LLHLIRARVGQTLRDDSLAQRALDEGLHLARHGGMELYLIELLCEQAALFLAQRNPTAAEPLASEARERALAWQCYFAWGAAEAGHLLGEALTAQRRTEAAGDVLQETLALRRGINHPRVWQTEEALAALGKQ